MITKFRSFGQTAIFLIGGKTIDEKPTAIYLKSGDIAVMSKESRLSYHAVPRILKTDVSWLNTPLPDEQNIGNDKNVNDDDDGTEATKNCPKKRKITENTIEDSFVEDIWDLVKDEPLWKPFADYISDCRININVRQVLEFGETSL